jgi:hypothetical protein
MQEEKPTHNLQRDREALAIAIAAIQFVIASEEYDASQSLASSR